MEVKLERMMKSVEGLVGSEIQGWVLTSEIGRGADGIVYVGRKDEVERAVKIYFPNVLKKNGLIAARERLELQLALIGKKHHPNLVEVFEGGDIPDLETIYLVMELVPGASLDKLIGRIPAKMVASLAGQLAAAARFLEEKLELVHRDIKPANIIISDDFNTLTLLDLGIVYRHCDQDEKGRLSGMEFVATVRYSPPEFVWREEEADIEGAWRAVTLYQIGATLHDMIMGKLLFDGYDTPRARLYDAVRYHTPVIESDSEEIGPWLIQAVQASLLKDWRKRLQLVAWNSFIVKTASLDVRQRERKICLMQAMNEERRQEASMKPIQVQGKSREQELWLLNGNLIGEVRKYLLDTQIFPKCSIDEQMISSQNYSTRIVFDEDLIKGFQKNVTFVVDLEIDEMMADATKLSFRAEVDGENISSATWTEMFSVETAFETCQQLFLEVVETLLQS